MADTIFSGKSVGIVGSVDGMTVNVLTRVLELVGARFTEYIYPTTDFVIDAPGEDGDGLRRAKLNVIGRWASAGKPEVISAERFFSLLPLGLLSRRDDGRYILAKADNSVGFTLVDIETTGFSWRDDAIIELAALRVRGGMPDETFSRLCNPHRPLPPEIVALTGITDEMLDGADDIGVAIRDFVDFIGSDTLVGYNIKAFDMKFIARAALEALGFEPNNPLRDILFEAQYKLPNECSHKLQNLAESLNLPKNGDAHRALADCYTTYELYRYLQNSSDVGDKLARNAQVTFDTAADIAQTAQVGAGISDSGNMSQNVSDVPQNISDVPQKAAKKPSAYRKAPWAKKDEPPQTPFEAFSITPSENHPLFGKSCVITGELGYTDRDTVKRLLQALGGSLKTSVSKKTDYLVEGTPEVDFVSGKLKTARELIEAGAAIRIITPQELRELIEWRG